MRLKHWLLATVGAVATFAIVPSAVVRADTIHVTNAGALGTPDGPNFDYTFNVSFDTLGELDSSVAPQFAQILAFPGLQSVSFVKDAGNTAFLSTLTFSTSTAGGNARVNFFTGTEIEYNAGAPDKTVSADEMIGVLTVVSSLPGTILAPTAWQSQDVGSVSEMADGGNSFVFAPTAVPLPATASMGLGLFGLLALAGIRKATRRNAMA